MKRTINRLVKFSLALLFLFLFSKCTTSNLVETWKDSEIKQLNPKKLIVICVNNSNSKRRIWEDSFVSELKKNGINAQASYNIFPKDIPSSDELNKSIDNDFDAVLMVKKVNEENIKYQTPGYTYPVYGGWHRIPFYRRYSGVYGYVHVPGYIERSKIYDIETSLYQLSDDGRLIWTAVTKTEGIKSTKDFSKEVCSLVIPKMQKDGLFPAQQ